MDLEPRGRPMTFSACVVNDTIYVSVHFIGHTYPINDNFVRIVLTIPEFATWLLYRPCVRCSSICQRTCQTCSACQLPPRFDITSCDSRQAFVHISLRFRCLMFAKVV
ncbi:hypothetical protein [Caudoviricetes sp.]|nr:hypothetical protein [Caudoviricetes sp.]